MAREARKHKVLIIDDEVLIREVVKAALLHSNFEAATLESPSLAETVIRQSKPDLILMDLYMPELNGLELLRKLRQDPKTADIPVIIFSGSHSKVDVISGQHAGAYEYVTKPVDNQVLVEKIRKILHLEESKRHAR